MGGKNKTHTTTQTTQVPGYVEDAQKALFGKTQELIEPYLTLQDGRVANLTNDHDLAFNHLRGAALDQYHPDKDLSGAIQDVAYRPDLDNYSKPGEHLAQAREQIIPEMRTASDGFFDYASGAADAAGQASQITGQNIAAMSNPFMRMVADGQIKQMRDSHDEMAADIGARAAAAGSFGGSREAVERSRLADNYVDQTSNAMAQNLAQGYNVGAGLAGQNASLADAAKARALQGHLSAAGLGQQGNLASANLSAQIANNAANLAYQGIQGANAARLGEANTRLAALTAGHDAKGDVFNRQLQGGQTVAGIGDVLRGYDQQQLDVPYNLLSQYAGIIPGVTGSTSTSSQPVYNNPASSILGSALMFGGLFG